MTDKVTDLMRRVAEKRRERMTAEQAGHRQIVDKRNQRLQSAPIKRGPAAPKDGTFGGKAA